MKAISHTDAKVCVTEIMELYSLSLSARVSFLSILHTHRKKLIVLLVSNYIVE